MASKIAIRVNLDPLETTAAFPYLGLNIAFNNINLEAPVRKSEEGAAAVVDGGEGVDK